MKAEDLERKFFTMQKHWKIFLVQHSHVDVGFTERQELIEEYQRQFVRQAVSLAASDKQNERGTKNKFKFTFEGFWAVEQFLKKATEQEKKQLIDGINKGYLELSAFYFHMAELPDERLLRKSLSYAENFAKKEHVKLNVAMSCDVNGFGWGMADALYDAGVRYLSSNINPHNGGKPLDQELVPFYWESPKGNKILVWNGFAYHKANLLGIMPGYNPDQDIEVPGVLIETKNGYVDVQDIRYAEKKVLPMLEALEKNGYPYNFLPVMGSGLYTDNSPASDQICDIVNMWNEKHGEQVEIVTATLEEFFHYLEENGGDIKTYKGDWNDWWSDGVASSPVPTMIFRNAQKTRNLIDMMDPEHKYNSEKDLDEIDHKLIMYSEHTWGHSSSVSYPWGKLVQQVRLRKGLYATEADVLACGALDNILLADGWGHFVARRAFRYKAINPNDSVMKGYVQMPVDFWESPQYDKGFTVRDQKGNVYPHQMVRTLRGQMVTIAAELLPKEHKEFWLDFDSGNHAVPAIDVSSNTFENDYYVLKWDEDKGVYSYIDKKTKTELIEQGKTLAQPLYQLFPDGDRGAADMFHGIENIPHSVIEYGKVQKVECSAGPVLVELRIHYHCAGTKDFVVTFTMFKDLPAIEVTATLTKTNVREPEGTYLAFPFQIEQGVWYLDKAGAAIRPGVDQLPKTCCDYYLVQNGAALLGSKVGVSVTIEDAPMVQLDRLKLWNYTKENNPTGTLYSWMTNNKWGTNFDATCGGFLEFKYVLQSGAFHSKENIMDTCKNNNYNFVTIRK